MKEGSAHAKRFLTVCAIAAGASSGSTRQGLAIKLFKRERQRLIITDASRDYLAVFRDAIDRIAIGTEQLLERQSLRRTSAEAARSGLLMFDA